jgi:hypothetical protein
MLYEYVNNVKLTDFYFRFDVKNAELSSLSAAH